MLLQKNARRTRFHELALNLKFTQSLINSFTTKSEYKIDEDNNNHHHKDLLTICSNSRSLHQTKQTHAFAILNRFLPRSVSLSASLILSYAAFQRLDFSLLLFEQAVTYCRTAFLWNTIIRAESIARIYNGFVTYNRMVRVGVLPDDHTFPFVLKICADNYKLKKGMEIHGCLFKYGFDTDLYVGNTLLLFYGNCGCLGNMDKVFNEMPERDIVSWNTGLGVFSVNGFCSEALDLYCEMNSSCEFKPNSVSVVSVLPVCSVFGDEKLVREIHCYVLKAGLDVEVTVRNALVDAYGKSGNLKGSRQAFDEMLERNEVSWNTIITSFAYLGSSRDALDMFRLMIYEGLKPSPIAISSMIPLLVDLQHLQFGKEIHGFSLRMGLESDIFVANSLIDMYAKAGHPTKAFSIFKKMAVRNVVSWNAMAASFAQNGLELKAVELIRDMMKFKEIPNPVTLTNILPACARVGLFHLGKEIHAKIFRMLFNRDIFVTNALTDMYAKCGYLTLAQNVFDMSIRDEISYNILIVGYSETSECVKSLSLFSEMRAVGMRYDLVSYVGVISACAHLAATKQGREMHGVLVRNHFHKHLFVANSLLDFYCKCGRIDIANKIFDWIPNKDAASWNTIILAYGMIGELDMAINLFEAMREEGLQYDSVSYIAALSACSHGGLVEKGRTYFDEMQAQNIKPTQMHYACMVDLFGRAGLMEDAVNLITNLPITADANIWGALLGASRIHGDLETGSWAAEHLFKLKPQHCGYYILLSNMYAEAGKWEEANKVRQLMKSRGAKKNPGCSWVQTKGQVHAFVIGEIMENYSPDLWVSESN